VVEEPGGRARIARAEKALKSRRLRSIAEIASCSLTLSLTGTIQDIAGCSLSLGRGTYVVLGVFHFRGNDQGSVAHGICDVGGSDESKEARWRPSADAFADATVSQVWLITLTRRTTVKLQAYRDLGVGAFTARLHTRIFAMRTGD